MNMLNKRTFQEWNLNVNELIGKSIKRIRRYVTYILVSSNIDVHFGLYLYE